MTGPNLTRQDVEFRTLDGLTLRAWLFPASQRGPALIISPGVSDRLPESIRLTLE